MTLILIQAPLVVWWQLAVRLCAVDAVRFSLGFGSLGLAFRGRT